MSGAPAVLTVENLSIASRHRTLVSGLNFTLHAGEKVGLIGESGSGKSLTSLAVMGLLPENLHASGSVKLLSRWPEAPSERASSAASHSTEIVGAPDRVLGRLRGLAVGMVFQEPMSALNPTMRVGDQVAEVVLQHRTVSGRGAAHARALDMLTNVRLPEPDRLFRAYPHELSGGQRQRVVLAIAMANRPRLLICDEPTTALDVTVQAQMLELIAEGVAADHSALLFITHDLAVVASVCERIIVMYGGDMLESGTTAQLLSTPKHPYTRGLLAASDLTSVDERGHVPTLPPRLFDYKQKLSRCSYCQAPDRPADEDRGRSRWITTDDGGYACVHEAVVA